VKIPHSCRSKEVMDCQILKYEWVTLLKYECITTWTGRDADLTAKKYREKLKTVQKLWHEKMCKGEN
jgi:hypothetical protein